MTGDETVWQYMPLPTLGLILSSEQLWLSHTSQLNDPAERTFVYEVYARLLRQAVESRRLLDRGEREEILHSAGGWVEDDRGLDTVGSFSASFSTSPDNMLLWLLYADGLTGVAVGFDKEGLAGSANRSVSERDDLSAWRLEGRRVIYGEVEVERVLRPVVENIVTRAWSLLASGTPVAAWIPDESFGQVSEVASRFKTSGWRQEEEWRLVCSIAAPLRAASDVVERESPYLSAPPRITLDVEMGSIIQGVVAGPLCDMQDLELTARGHKVAHLVTRSPTVFRRSHG